MSAYIMHNPKTNKRAIIVGDAKARKVVYSYSQETGIEDINAPYSRDLVVHEIHINVSRAVWAKALNLPKSWQTRSGWKEEAEDLILDFGGTPTTNWRKLKRWLKANEIPYKEVVTTEFAVDPIAESLRITGGNSLLK